MTREQKVAWAAGVWECLGWVGCTGKCNQLQAYASSSDLSLLKRFRKVVGFGNIHGPYNSGTTYQWRIGSVEGYHALATLLSPFLPAAWSEKFSKPWMVRFKSTKRSRKP